MTTLPFSYEDFEATRERLVKEIHLKLTNTDKQFLISFKRGEPNWDLFPYPNLQHMPATQWKLQNIQKLMRTNPQKHTEQLKALENYLQVL